MKILVICQYYYPEPFRHPDVCEELVKLGHNVTVVTGMPNYPMGKIYEGYKGNDKKDEIINGVKIHRCFTIPRKRGILYRFLNYYSYAISSKLYVKKLKEKYDVVYVHQLSPVIMANAALAYKKQHKTKVVLYCLDLWPESLIAGGIKNGSIIYNLFYKLSKKIYKSVDKILTTSKSFSKYFKEKFGIVNTEYLPQFSEALFNPEECRKSQNEYVDLMFAGNIGVAQGLDIIIDAAEKLKNENCIRWHIVGDGIELDRLKRRAQDMPQIIFYGRKSLTEMPKYYAMADAMLVTMKKDKYTNYTLPGKVQTYMSAGKVIIGSADGETQDIIKQSNSGYCSDAEDVDGFVENIKKFINNKSKDILQKNSREYYLDNFDKKIHIEKLEKNLGCFVNENFND